MKRQYRLQDLVYHQLYPKPTASDPPDFHQHLVRNLITEVRIETNRFYGGLELTEAKYPGLDYARDSHRMRLGKFPHHARLFHAFDQLGMTSWEIHDLCKWEGTLWARKRYERDEGIRVYDTTGKEIKPWVKKGGSVTGHKRTSSGRMKPEFPASLEYLEYRPISSRRAEARPRPKTPPHERSKWFTARLEQWPQLSATPTRVQQAYFAPRIEPQAEIPPIESSRQYHGGEVTRFEPATASPSTPTQESSAFTQHQSSNVFSPTIVRATESTSVHVHQQPTVPTPPPSPPRDTLEKDEHVNMLDALAQTFQLETVQLQSDQRCDRNEPEAKTRADSPQDPESSDRKEPESTIVPFNFVPPSPPASPCVA